MSPHLAADGWASLARPELQEALRHLLRCPRCRRRLGAVFFDPEPEATGETQGDWPGLQALFESLDELGFARRLPPTSGDAQALFEELTHLAPEYRLEVLDGSTRFHVPGVAELLTGAAEEAAPDEPLRSHHLALLAVALLEHLEPTTRVRRLLALAYCLLGEADRRRGRLDIADDHLANAVHQLESDPVQIETRARLSLVLGHLRQDQRRTDEALALYDRSRTLSEELGQDAAQATASLALGALLLDEDDAELALPFLWEAFHLSSEDPNPATTFATLHALALALAEWDRNQELDQVLSDLEALRARMPGPLDSLRIDWIKARVGWHRGEHEKALDELSSVLDRLLQRPSPIEAARAGVELAILSLEADSPPETLHRIADKLASLGHELLPASIAAVIELVLHLPSRASKGFFMDALMSVSAYLDKAQFDPGLPYFPLPDPDLVVAWTEVSLRQRHAAANAAGVELDVRGEPRSEMELRLICWAHEVLTGVRIHLPESFSIDEAQREATWPS